MDKVNSCLFVNSLEDFTPKRTPQPTKERKETLSIHSDDHTSLENVFLNDKSNYYELLPCHAMATVTFKQNSFSKLVRVLDVVFGEKHNLMTISNPEDNGLGFKLFGWGIENNGCLGFGNSRVFPAREMTNVMDLIRKERIMPHTKLEMFCGDDFSLFLNSTDGHLYSCGNTGLVPRKQYHTPQRVKIDEKEYHVERVACSGKHGLILVRERTSGKRKVFGFGDSGSYQLGCEGNVKELHEVKVLSKSSRDQIVDVKCGDNFSVFLTLRGFIYGCGDNSFQQLGKERTYIVIMDVMRLSSKEFDYEKYGVRDVCCGKMFTVIVTKTGQVFSTIKPWHVQSQPRGFYEMEYFTKNRIQIQTAYTSSNGIILKTKQGALYYYHVKSERTYSSIGRIEYKDPPIPILTSVMNRNSSLGKHVYASNASDRIAVVHVGLSNEMESFFQRMHQGLYRSDFYDIQLVLQQLGSKSSDGKSLRWIIYEQ